MRTVRQLLASKAPDRSESDRGRSDRGRSDIGGYDRGGSEIFAIGPDAAVIDAIRLMAEKRIGAVLVMEGPRLVGILSERDYARKVVLEGRSSKDTAVREIMTTEVVSVGPEDTADACMQIVTERRIRHLPVREGDEVVGVISIGDLVKAVIEDQQLELDQLQRYIAS